MNKRSIGGGSLAVAVTMALCASLGAQDVAKAPQRYRVRVVDGSGGGGVQGVPIALVDPGKVGSFPLGITDVQGAVDTPNPLGAWRCALRLGFPLADAELRQPADGEIVEFQDVERGALRLWIADGRQAIEAVISCASDDVLFAGVVDKPGVVDFPHLGLGLDLTIRLRFAEDEAPLELEMKGPTRPREMLVEEVSASRRATLRVRLIGQDGSPQRGMRFDLVFPDAQSHGLAARMLTTDGDGRVQFELPLSLHDREGEASRVWLKRHDAHPGGGSAAVRFVPVKNPGVQDLGDLRLEDDPERLRGRVVGPDGYPVAGLALRLEMHMRWLGGVPEDRLHGLRSIMPTDAGGNFVVTAWKPTEKASTSIRLYSESSQWILDRESLRLGEDVAEETLRAIPAGRAELQLKDTGVAGFDGFAYLVSEQDGERLPASTTDKARSRLCWPIAPAQRCRVELRSQFDDLIYRSDVLELRQGQKLVIPSISCAEVGTLGTLKFSGQHHGRPAGIFFDRRPVRGFDAKRDATRLACWVGEAGLPALEARFWGCHPVKIEPGSGGRSVTLRRQPEVVVRLEGLRERAVPLQFRAERPLDPDRDLPRRIPAWTGVHEACSVPFVDGVARLPMPLAGQQYVTLSVCTGPGETELEFVQLEVDVPEKGSVAVTHRFTAAVLNQLLRDLEEAK